MAKIKNWTVTSMAVKGKTSGLIKYINYLNNPNEESHIRKNTQIINIFNKNKESAFIKKCCEEAITLDMANQEKNLGGRPVESYAVSFDLVLPKNTIRPTTDQWKSIAKDIYKTIAGRTDGKLTQEHVYMNIHDQDNPHLNVVVSKILDGKRERKIDQKAMLNAIKMQFNKSVLEHCNFDYRDYIPVNENLGKRLEDWQFQQQKESKAIEKVFKQFEKLVDYVNESNEARINSTKNRIKKSMEQLSDENKIRVLDTMDDTLDPSFQETLSDIKSAFEDYEVIKITRGKSQKFTEDKKG